ncbi:GNAT family acetyltransferase [Thalassolituus sp. HI0120]|nr:GNAT family acetyltransferase [Thalassolituus sp. HI0120]KZZ41237.1 GNAT family acetyltransferase [Thalassolituus sp. HI0120]
MQADIIIADYNNVEHQQIIGQLMNQYAQDPMGGGEALKQQVIDNLAIELAKVANAFTVLAIAEGNAVGLINAMQGFSTFKCQPLINIHDVIVSSACRGMGIAQRMMDKVEDVARQRGCCKLTLEVLEGNLAAQASYRKSGFAGYELDPEMGNAMFWQKFLD